MSIFLANVGLTKLFACEQTYLSSMHIHLFVNNVTPDCGYAASAFTEPTDSGYTSTQPLTFAFGAPFLNGVFFGSCEEVEFDAPNYTWTFTHSAGDFTVYGWFATDPGTGVLVMSERAASPFAVTAAGQTYTLIPKILGFSFS